MRPEGAGEQAAPLPAEAERRLSRLRERDGAPRMPPARPPHTTPLLSESEPGESPVLLLPLLVPRSPLVGPLDSLGQRGAPGQAGPSSSHRPAGSRAASPPHGRGSGPPDIVGLRRASSGPDPGAGARPRVGAAGQPPGRAQSARAPLRVAGRPGGALSPARTQTWDADAGPGPPWVLTAATSIGALASVRRRRPVSVWASARAARFAKASTVPARCRQGAPQP